MTRFLIYIFLMFGFVINAQTQSQKEILKKIYTKYDGHQSISYDIEYMMKFFDESEPFYVNSHVDIIKSNTDTIFNQLFLYSRKDTLFDLIKYYKPDSLFVINLKDQLITSFDPTKGETSTITGNVDGDVLEAGFEEVNKLKRSLANVNNKIVYKDTLYFLKITIELPNGEDIYGKKKTFVIDKKNYLISQINFEARYKDQIQKNQWLLNNIVFDKVTEVSLSNKVVQYFKEFKKEKYVRLTEKDYELIPNGEVAPELKGTFYPNYVDEIKLKTNKVTILDFWYTRCMPCIKVIPHLNKIKEKYKDKIEVIGVNPVENTENDKERIDKFLKRTPIQYPILLISEGLNEFNIRAYPTLYILDKSNKVIYSKIGSSEDTFAELDKILTEYFK